MIEIPEGSLYFWCYTQGLKHADFGKLTQAVAMAGRNLRDKDVQNYWNGWYRSSLYGPQNQYDMFVLHHSNQALEFQASKLEDYPLNPYWDQPEIEERWVPCNKDNKPMIKWGNGCLSREDAEAYRQQVYLAENLKGGKLIVVDCDGDHDAELDLALVAFLYRFTDRTHALFKPKLITDYPGYEGSNMHMPASFHLTFMTDRVIPTMHFPKAHIDIIGNRANSLRYLKNTIWNGVQPRMLTPNIWEQIQEFVERRNNGTELA